MAWWWSDDRPPLFFSRPPLAGFGRLQQQASFESPLCAAEEERPPPLLLLLVFVKGIHGASVGGHRRLLHHHHDGRSPLPCVNAFVCAELLLPLVPPSSSSSVSGCGCGGRGGFARVRGNKARTPSLFCSSPHSPGASHPTPPPRGGEGRGGRLDCSFFFLPCGKEEEKEGNCGRGWWLVSQAGSKARDTATTEKPLQTHRCTEKREEGPPFSVVNAKARLVGSFSPSPSSRASLYVLRSSSS